MGFERILVAIDGSAGSARALDAAIDLAAATGSTLTALAVEGPLPAYAATLGEVEEVKREKDTFFAELTAGARAKAERAGVELEMDVRPGHAAELIVRYANDGEFDLVVVGHKGHFLGNYLLGSTADRVAHHASCPVMIVK
jgi:nucleotide-binding universal stress UspA family protein